MDANSWNGEPGACSWDRERQGRPPNAVCCQCRAEFWIDPRDGYQMHVLCDRCCRERDATSDQGGLVHAECRR